MWIVDPETHLGASVKASQPFTPSEGGDFQRSGLFQAKDVTAGIHRFSMTEQFIFAVTEASQVAEVRRQVVALASKLGFNQTDVGKAAIVATEAATNLAKHAVQGEVVVRLLEDQDRSGIEILALDKGPGMVNVAQSLRDGYSTAGSPGTGMGAMRRLARSFDLHSDPTKGTAVLAEVWSGRGVGGKVSGFDGRGSGLQGEAQRSGLWRRLGSSQFHRDVCCFWLWMAWATDSALPPQPRKPFESSGRTFSIVRPESSRRPTRLCVPRGALCLGLLK